jgi:signal transduction histidine kinase
MRLGWAAGRAAYHAGLSVHHVVRDADLLLAVVLADVERAVADHPAAATAGAAEAFAIARRLQRGAGRYGQAAVSGFIHALLGTLRERYRLLRHDLRNPLGTIRSALSLMEDESVPAETRHGPGIRAMVARNAGSLDSLITRSLDDAAATALLAPMQEVALRDVALAARREAREAARLAGAEVLVDLPDAATPQIDGAALELTLTALLLAGIARAVPGTVLRVTAGAPDGVGAGVDAWALVAVAVERPDEAETDEDGEPATYWEEQGLRLAVELARDHGAHLAADTLSPRTRDLDALVVGLLLARTVYVRLPVPVRPAA